jgi:dihydrolipoamide dehydrogenase
MKNPSDSVFDLIVIGAGPGGYTAAIKASQLGMKVACIEKNPSLGGTCLNVGCIPSKALLYFSKTYEQAKTEFSGIGINAQVSLDLSVMMERKSKIVADLCKGIEGLFAKNKVTKLTGSATIIGHDKVLLVNDQKTELTAKNILIATGSEIIELPNILIDEKRIISSTGALSLNSVPEKLAIIGGGYIGLELGSVWRRLGAEVTVIEYANSFLPHMDIDVSKELYKLLQKQGIKFKLGTKVDSAVATNSNVKIDLELIDSKTRETIESDVALVSVGRKPFTKGLGLEGVGINLDATGRILVDQNYRTNHQSVYAIGDVISGPMLAHKAEEEAIAAVEIMAGQHGHVNYNLIPSVIYTSPEVASVGATEQQLKQAKVPYKVGKFPFLANSKARTSTHTEGFVKILADQNTDKILGAHIIGNEASVMISEITLGMEFSASAEDIARTCHPHPTLSEAVREAALAVDGKAINF